jgi:membrane associated rhomboid family serine protease
MVPAYHLLAAARRIRVIIPFKTKNPPEHFPYVTLILIVVNVLIYFLTSLGNYCLSIDESVIDQFAVSHQTLSLWRLTTAMFLHANLEHIIGNMLFLWIFGAAVEGRLRPDKFIIIYVISGWTGGLLSDIILGAIRPDTPSLGASGAIMGIAGAYLYMFPFSRVRLFYLLPLGVYFRFGLAEWQAIWVVLVYVGMDILFGVLLRSADGVGHFAHLGGFGTGLLSVLIMRARRDTAEVSEAQAVLDETKRDYTQLAYSDLEAMLQQPSDNMDLVMAFCEKSCAYGDPGKQQKCMAYLNYYAPRLFAQADPNRLGPVLLSLPPNAGTLPLVYYLRLGSRLEAATSNSLAAQIYRRVYDLAPYAPESEMALYRTAQLMTNIFNNRAHAAASYQEILRLFPHGEMAIQARQQLQRLL